ncbi:MAG TPA: DUF2272 domain-containing protein, partial [Gammaproteobacteria bacterium]|nr:DUF2272 domain-containing protein [Gammaproteobacteria bacterium]
MEQATLTTGESRYRLYAGAWSWLSVGRCAVIAAAAILGTAAHGQVPPLNRLPARLLDVASPELRVSGQPGQIRVEQAACTPRTDVTKRTRIVDIAVQEWAFFGFHVVDQTGPPPPRRSGGYRRRSWMDHTESARVAASIAGYWSVTPDGSWIIDRQNSFWRGPLGVGARWRDPWSAAFVSWTMCEAGIAPSSAFRRSINHRTYIDQAIRARDSSDDSAAFTAWDVGERVIEP